MSIENIFIEMELWFFKNLLMPNHNWKLAFYIYSQTRSFFPWNGRLRVGNKKRGSHRNFMDVAFFLLQWQVLSLESGRLRHILGKVLPQPKNFCTAEKINCWMLRMKNDTNEIIDGIITCFLGELMGHSCLIEMNITLVAWICLLVKESTYDKGNIIHSGIFQPSAPTILRNGHLHMLLSSFCTSQSPSH